ncbi:hypothetical protein [Tateyamaria pelophila]|uniref:hypothetical protein n=1 Tax=Tateyamaria pelophila TaxID=328415 RepID=UPI001CC0D84D|nr:hypothetical protein [Tateyamaria pelophila]
MTSRISVSMFPAVTIRERLIRWRNTRSLAAVCALASSLVVAGCIETPVEVAVSEPDPELVFVRGYRSPSDECQLVGESAFTIDFLDDASDLVACPTGSSAMETLMAETDSRIVTQTNSFTFFSLPYR